MGDAKNTKCYWGIRIYTAMLSEDWLVFKQQSQNLWNRPADSWHLCNRCPSVRKTRLGQPTPNCYSEQRAQPRPLLHSAVM
jgi:hypothetical protein